MAQQVLGEAGDRGRTEGRRGELPHWPCFSEEAAIAAVEETLRSGKVNYWTGQQGHGVRAALRRVAGQQVRHQP